MVSLVEVVQEFKENLAGGSLNLEGVELRVGLKKGLSGLPFGGQV